MPFDISRASGLWQQKMNEGLSVIAENFLICWFGTSKEEAIANHDAKNTFISLPHKGYGT